MFLSFSSSLARYWYSSSFSLSYNFIQWSAVRTKSMRCLVIFFLLINTKTSLLAGISWFICILRSYKILSDTFSRLVYIPFVTMANILSPAQFSVYHILFPVMFTLMFLSYQFASFDYYVIVLFLSLRSLHLLFNCLLSIFALTSSSSCRGASTDIPDPLSPHLPFVHRLRQVFRATSYILT